MLSKIINILNNGGRWNVGKIRYYVCRFLMRIRTTKHNMYYITKWDISQIDERLRGVDDIYKDKLSDLEDAIEDKCDEYQVEDVIYNNIGSVDDLATYDDIEDINDKLNTIIDEDLKVIYDKLIRFDTIKDDVSISIENDDNAQRILDLVIERDVLVDDVIQSIINRLDNCDKCYPNDNV